MRLARALERIGPDDVAVAPHLALRAADGLVGLARGRLPVRAPEPDARSSEPDDRDPDVDAQPEDVISRIDADQLEAARSDITEADRTAAADESLKYGGRKYRGSELSGSMGGEEAKKYYENLISKRKGV